MAEKRALTMKEREALIHAYDLADDEYQHARKSGRPHAEIERCRIARDRAFRARFREGV